MTLLDKKSGKTLRFEIVRSLDFSVERKRQSLVVKNPNDGRLYVFMKGADEVIYRLLSDCNSTADETIKQKEAVERFAEEGLRTLVFAMKVFDDSVNEPAVQKMTEEEIESEMRLIGVAGEADMMQKDVQKCIADFIKAGIKVWIVTGDKDSTAKTVGYASGILSHKREIRHLKSENQADLIQAVLAEDLGEDIMISGTAIEVLINATQSSSELTEAERKSLVAAFMRAKGFVVYRSSPKQKAALVQFVKRVCKNTTTLAIGDGANDVNMI